MPISLRTTQSPRVAKKKKCVVSRKLEFLLQDLANSRFLKAGFM